MSKIKTNQFFELALEQIPRLLGQLNRNPSSSAYGSFDRAFWHYRTNDISCARYQEAVYTLSLLYFTDFENNPYYKDEKILEWIQASLKFSASIQRTNGSFDEWYVNEGSYVATAFLTVALGETVRLFKQNNTQLNDEEIILKTLNKAAVFLVKTKESTVMNQVSGAIYAIALVGEIIGKKEFSQTTEDFLDEFVAEQNKEGWWKEYGGPDIGYLTLTISYLEKHSRLTGSKKSDQAITNAKTFVEFFIHPDMTAGGEYMSRNTEYIIPTKTLPYIGAVAPVNLDDRYLCYILYNWLEAGIQTTPQEFNIKRGEKYFSESGILRIANDSYFLVANGKKGGSFRLYCREKSCYDSGAEITLKDKKLSTGILDNKNEVVFGNQVLNVNGYAKNIKEPMLDTKMAVAFKGWQLTFGRISFFQKFVKNFLRPRMVSYSGDSKLLFSRKIECRAKTVVITDEIGGEVSRDDILLGAKSAYSAVPSSKYMAASELAQSRLDPVIEEKYDQQPNKLIIKRTFNFNE